MLWERQGDEIQVVTRASQNASAAAAANIQIPFDFKRHAAITAKTTMPAWMSNASPLKIKKFRTLASPGGDVHKISAVPWLPNFENCLYLPLR